MKNRIIRTLICIVMMVIPVTVLVYGLQISKVLAAPDVETSITIIKEANPADGTDFLFTTNALPLGNFLSKWGSSGTADGQLDFPYGIAVDPAGNVYVSDFSNDRVQKFDSVGNYQSKWDTGSTEGLVDGPTGLTIDSSGNVYVVESANKRIQVFDSTGNFVRMWGWDVISGNITTTFEICTSNCKAGTAGTGDGQFANPVGIALDSIGNVYVTDYTNDTVQKFDSSGAFIAKWGTTGTQEGAFNSPTGIAIDTANNIYVTDASNNRVQVFDTSGSFTRMWGWGVAGGVGLETCISGCQAAVDGTAIGQLSRPEGISIDSAGRVYVVDRNNDRVQVFSSIGSYLQIWGSSGSGNGQFNTPGLLTLDSFDRVYVSDGTNDRIQVFGPNFTLDDAAPDDSDSITTTRVFSGLSAGSYSFTELLPGETGYVVKDISCTGGTATPILAAKSVTVDLSDGDNVVCTFTNNITAITIIKDASPADGTNFNFQTNAIAFSNKWGVQGPANGEFEFPRGVATDGAGNIYVTDFVNRRIQKFDSNGAFLTAWGGLGTGDGQFYGPWAIAVDGSDNVYVTDITLNRIQVFDSSGNYLAKWGSTGSAEVQFESPKGLMVNGIGDVYVADTNNHRIQVFDSSGVFKYTWGRGVRDGSPYGQLCTSSCQAGSPGAANYEFNSPEGLSVDNVDNIYVADSGNNRIQVFSHPQTLIAKWGSLGLSAGQFSGVKSVALDKGGNVYVAEYGNNRIQVFDNNGVFKMMWGWGVKGGAGFEICTSGCQAGDSGSGNGQFFQPWSLAVGAPGNVYVADTYNHRIQVFNGATFFLDDAAIDDGDLIGDTKVVTGLTPDVYHFTEILPGGGWELSGLTCEGGITTPDLGNASVSIDLAEGDYVVCTFSNLGPGSITISKDAEPSNGQDFTFSTNAFPSGEFLRTWGWDVTSGNITTTFEICTSNCQRGTTGSGDGQFSTTYDVAKDGAGNTYVLDYGNNRVQKHDSSGAFVSAWGWGVAGGSSYEICTSNCQTGAQGGEAGQFFYPYGIAADQSGNVYLTEIGNNRVQKFDSNGNFLRMWGWGVATGADAFEICTSGCQAGIDGFGIGQFRNPAGVDVDTVGNVYVADIDGHRVMKYDSNGNYITNIGNIYGEGAGDFVFPRDVSIDNAGNIYVVESGNDRVQKFDSSGAFVSMWGWGVDTGASAFEICTDYCRPGIEGNGNGQLLNAYGISTDALGNVYVADTGNHRIQRFDSSGHFSAVWGKDVGGAGIDFCTSDCAAASFSSAGGHFGSPYGVEVDAAGNMYVADAGNRRIQQFIVSDGSFTLDDAIPDDNDGISSSKVITNLLAGTYTFTENLPPGWNLTNLACLGGNTTIDLASERVIVDLSLGDEVACTFSNTGLGSITIVKEADPADGTDFPFSTNALISGTFTLDDALTDDADGITSTIVLTDLASGIYTFTEDLPPGWFLDDLSCSGGSTSPDVGSASLSVNLAEGDTVLCTFTNKKFGSITIIKDANPADGTDFTFTTNALISGTFELDDAVPDDADGITSTRVITGLVAGVYTFTEVLPAGWGLTDISCSSGSWTPDLGSAGLQVDLSFGDDAVCTFTNSDQSTLTIVKDAGPADGTDFAFTTNARPAGMYSRQWGGLSQPRGIAVDAAGRLYVANFSADQIRVFDSTGSLLIQWGSGGSGDGQFSLPADIAVGPTGDVYVADTYNNRIQRFTSTGVYVGQWNSGIGAFSTPFGVAVDSAGFVYVADSSNHRIQVFDSTGGYQTSWGSAGAGDGEFNSPNDVAVDAAGNVYVADTYNNRIQVFDSSGVYQNQWGGFYWPASVAVDGAGRVYVTDTENHRIQVFDSTGTLLSQWGSNGNGNGSFLLPRGIAVDLAGEVFVSDSENNRIQVFSSSTFSLDDAQPDDGDIITDTWSISLDGGIYTVTENLPAGWALSGLTCDSGSWSVNGPSVSVDLALGEAVTCTFSNFQAATTSYCGVVASTTYAFGDLKIDIPSAGPGDIDCLEVTAFPVNHPDASPGIQTGAYWKINAIDDAGQPANSFSIDLTLVTPFVPDANDKLCRYTGVGQTWDCAADSFDAGLQTITRLNVTQLSDWAIGNNVGPTAVRLTSFSAQAAFPVNWIGWLVALSGIGLLVWRWRMRRTGQEE